MSNYITHYWGKQHGAVPEGPPYHPVAYHNLDVAACMQALLHKNPWLVARLEAMSGLSREDLVTWLVFLAAIHDAGKFMDSFQQMVPGLMLELQGRSSQAPRARHDQMSVRLWDDLFQGQLVTLRGDSRRALGALKPLADAVLSHHGNPPVPNTAPDPLAFHAPAPVMRDVDAWFEATVALLLPASAQLQRQAGLEARLRGAAWIVAGLAIAADWLGSSLDWFAYQEPTRSLEAYWREVALPAAERAVTESGLVRCAPGPFEGMARLFPMIQAPTPLQRLMQEMPLPAEPQLWVLEEATGGGKTEAALTLAHRLMDQGLGAGLYYALPTMATSNAMHARVQRMFRALYGPDVEPSLVLAHSAQKLALRLASAQEGAQERYGQAEVTASLDCKAWLGQGHKRALLADVGVGTIDQALLSVLAVRHQALRLMGLCHKVLLVDEVHACDAYVHKVLCRLLFFHAAMGGSAILLSATLPQTQRRALVEAFASGRGERLEAPPQVEAWPLASGWSRGGGLRELPTEIRPEVRRAVKAQLLRSPQAVEAQIAAWLEQGRCVCYLRNTVADAIGTYERWVERRGAGQVTLFHSRFVLGDRLRIEADVLERFGPDSGPAQRRGQLLIATQVVEQSLDLDFDAMVTDLAPADLLIQRAGRMRRHRRDADGARVDGQDQRGEAVMAILAPAADAEAGDGWYRGLLPRAAMVYPNHGQLWLTAAWLERQGGFSMPEDARGWIEAVYSEEAQDTIPAGLLGRSERAQAQESSQRSHALWNTLQWDAGYSAHSGAWEAEDRAPTRLGEPTSQVRLARRAGGQVLPWWPDGPMRWQQSEVRIAARKIAAPAMDEEALKALLESMPDKGRYCVPVIMGQTPEGWRGRALNESGRLIVVAYDSCRGLETFEEER